MANKRIIITVIGGIAEVDQATIPEGIEVIIKDYDIDGSGEDYLRQDENGDNYAETIWTRIG